MLLHAVPKLRRNTAFFPRTLVIGQSPYPERIPSLEQRRYCRTYPWLFVVAARTERIFNILVTSSGRVAEQQYQIAPGSGISQTDIIQMDDIGLDRV